MPSYLTSLSSTVRPSCKSRPSLCPPCLWKQTPPGWQHDAWWLSWKPRSRPRLEEPRICGCFLWFHLFPFTRQERFFILFLYFFQMWKFGAARLKCVISAWRPWTELQTWTPLMPGAERCYTTVSGCKSQRFGFWCVSHASKSLPLPVCGEKSGFLTLQKKQTEKKTMYFFNSVINFGLQCVCRWARRDDKNLASVCVWRCVPRHKGSVFIGRLHWQHLENVWLTVWQNSQSLCFILSRC